MKNLMTMIILMFCIIFSSATVFAEEIEYASTQTENQFLDNSVLYRYDNNASSGFTFGLGAGYALYFAGDVNLTIGYDIMPGNDQDFSKPHVGVGLYANIHGSIGDPFAAHVNFIPTLLVTKSSFRFSAGLGLGGSYINFGGDDEYAGFLFNLEVKFLWFVSNHCYLGFGFDSPILAGYIIYSEDRSREGNYAVAPMFNAYLTIGFKWKAN